MQKYDFCLYAHDNNLTHNQYIDWIELKWRVRVDKSTITQILQIKNKRITTEVINLKAKHHKPIIFPELELVLKEFILLYQNRIILSDALLIKKAKLLADELEISQGILQYFTG